MPRQLQYLLFANHVGFNNLMLHLHWDFKLSAWIHEHSVRVTDVLAPYWVNYTFLLVSSAAEQNQESTQLLTLPFIEYLSEAQMLRIILRYILFQLHLLRYSSAFT